MLWVSWGVPGASPVVASMFWSRWFTPFRFRHRRRQVTSLRLDRCTHVQKSSHSFRFNVIDNRVEAMAALHKRRQELGDRKLRREEAPPRAAGSDAAPQRRLAAAALYGLSSFLIVVVNKSVLTSYRWRAKCTQPWEGARILNRSSGMFWRSASSFPTWRFFKHRRSLGGKCFLLKFISYAIKPFDISGVQTICYQ